MAGSWYSPAQAAEKYERLQQRSLFTWLPALFSKQPPDSLLPFEKVQSLLHARTPIVRGTQMISLAHIVGSVGRYRDFDRAFVPLNPASGERWKQLDVALNELKPLPPIDVYLVADVYFVRDGNHRVSVARANGLTEIEARVIEIPTRIHLSPDVDISELIRQVEYEGFLERTRLDESRPEHDLKVSVPGHYDTLLHHIEVHQYFRGIEEQTDVTFADAAMSWYDTVYLPVIEAIRATPVLQEFPTRTEADIYLWVAYHREKLRQGDADPPPAEAVATGLARKYSERPLPKVLKTVARAVRAAVKAARESPEPPVD